MCANADESDAGPQRPQCGHRKKFGAPAVTKDGVTVAKEIELEDAIENMGAQMVKEVASKTGRHRRRRYYHRYGSGPDHHLRRPENGCRRFQPHGPQTRNRQSRCESG